MTQSTPPHLDWTLALDAIDRGETSEATERALVEAVRRIKRRKKKTRRGKKQQTRDVLRASTGRVNKHITPRALPPAERPAPQELPNHANCYVCKAPYRELHPFYHLLCPACGEANFQKREPEMDLRGRRALVTGGRTKIGFRCAVVLLRAGAHVTVTTRYPFDAYRRYAQENDWEEFRDRLKIEQVDFRDIQATQAFLDEEVRRGVPLDILVNQAAQTIRASETLESAERGRDAEIAHELKALGGGDLHFLPAMRPAAGSEPAEVSHAALATISRTAIARYVADNALVADPDHGELVDRNARNTWDLDLEDVSLAEFLEVQSINVFAPYTFTARLAPLMKRSSFPDRYVVQVTAIEGQFYGAPKSGRHPHTNMAKAALHMLVRTSAEALARHGIYMNAVDPGWVSDQSAILKRKPGKNFCPPLDIIDGAARILDPIVQGLRGDKIHGQILKDYAPASW